MTYQCNLSIFGEFSGLGALRDERCNFRCQRAESYKAVVGRSLGSGVMDRVRLWWLAILTVLQ